MFDIELTANLAKVTLRVEAHDGVIVRRMRLALDRELDAELAHGLGKGATKARGLLVAHDVEKCTLGLGAVEAIAALVAAKDKIKIGQLRGTKATLTAAEDSDGTPAARLEFEAPYSDDVWAFLGRHCGAYVQITFTRRQLELAGAA